MRKLMLAEETAQAVIAAAVAAGSPSETVAGLSQPSLFSFAVHQHRVQVEHPFLSSQMFKVRR